MDGWPFRRIIPNCMREPFSMLKRVPINWVSRNILPKMFDMRAIRWNLPFSLTLRLAHEKTRSESMGSLSTSKRDIRRAPSASVESLNWLFANIQSRCQSEVPQFTQFSIGNEAFYPRLSTFLVCNWLELFASNNLVCLLHCIVCTTQAIAKRECTVRAAQNMCL